MYSTFTVNNQVFDLTHLNPQQFQIKIAEDFYTANLQFGNHCFTDEKENGPLFSTKLRKDGSYEYRYFSKNRFLDTQQLPDILKTIFTENSSYYVIPFKRANDEQYHYLDNGYFAIFFYLNKIDIVNKTLNIYVISAYDKTTYTSNLPKGKPFKLSFVLFKRTKGEYLIK
ncbi:TPA: hypothetical protein ACPSFP_001760 [Haemophilus influenzae]